MRRFTLYIIGLGFWVLSSWVLGALGVGVGLGVGVLRAQSAFPDEKFRQPLDIPVRLSASYGELRGDHFHSGIDYKVVNGAAEPVHAVKSGYVSRISASPRGYGYVVYITHPDGTMSVYAHLRNFHNTLARKVLAEQYRRQSFSVDIQMRPEDFPVKQGDFIGRVGNTGGSFGPHLHFELRENWGTRPMNVVARGLVPVRDTVPPVIRRVAFLASGDSLPLVYAVKLASGKLELPGASHMSSHDTLRVPSSFYVGVDAVNKLPEMWHNYAVENYSVSIDGRTIYEFCLGEFTFADQKYYRDLVVPGFPGADLLSTYVPSDRHPFLGKKIKAVDHGVISLQDDDIHKVTVRVSDLSGNHAARSFKVMRDTLAVGTPLLPVEVHDDPCDSIPPVIKPLRQAGAKLTKGHACDYWVYSAVEVPFKISDSSQISSSEAKVDGEWALSLYRKGVLTVFMDAEHYTPGTHTVWVRAVDSAGNAAETELSVVL